MPSVCVTRCASGPTGASSAARVVNTPEGVEIARYDEASSSWEQDILGYPIVVVTGVRARWTANTILRDPSWRKGRGPHCALHMNAAGAAGLGIENWTAVSVTSRRGSVRVLAEIDEGSDEAPLGCRTTSVWSMPRTAATMKCTV